MVGTFNSIQRLIESQSFPKPKKRGNDWFKFFFWVSIWSILVILVNIPESSHISTKENKLEDKKYPLYKEPATKPIKGSKKDSRFNNYKDLENYILENFPEEIGEIEDIIREEENDYEGDYQEEAISIFIEDYMKPGKNVFSASKKEWEMIRRDERKGYKPTKEYWNGEYK